MSNVEYGLKTPWTVSKSSFSVYVASPKQKRKVKIGRPGIRQHAESGAFAGPTGEVGNEQLRYSTVNSEGDEYPEREDLVLGSYFALEKQTQASKSSCQKVYEEENKESKCVLIQLAGSYSNRKTWKKEKNI